MKEREPKRHKARRFVAASALSLGSSLGLTPVVESLRPASASELPQSILTKKDPGEKPAKLKTEKKKKGKESSLTKRKKELRRLETNFEAFFKLTNEDITDWAYQTDSSGVNNVIYGSYGDGPWGFPRWEPNRSTAYHNGDDTFSTIIYNETFTAEIGPHLSLFEFDSEDESYQFVAINLGTANLPLKSSADGEVSVTFMGLVFPPALGGQKLILPVLTSAADPSNPEFQKFPVKGELGNFYLDAPSKNNLQSSNFKPVQFVKRKEVLNKLENTIGKPISFITQNGSKPIPGDPEGKYNLMSPPVRNFYLNFQLLLGGNMSLFQQKIDEAALQGLVITEANRSPAYLKNDFHDFDEAYNTIAFVGCAFIKNAVPVLQIK
ncbi:hypothetical protein HYT33_01810 [Candidatus Roizmanbacteria bacterium]|nr:hypothetical protein [Candidatus Roizmanbacteria bacterium]